MSVLRNKLASERYELTNFVRGRGIESLFLRTLDRKKTLPRACCPRGNVGIYNSTCAPEPRCSQAVMGEEEKLGERLG